MEPISSQFSFWYPFRLYEFTDGFFITSARMNQEAFASHQCVNKVDPTNHNADAIRKRLAEPGGEKTPEPPECPVH